MAAYRGGPGANDVTVTKRPGGGRGRGDKAGARGAGAAGGGDGEVVKGQGATSGPRWRGHDEGP